MVFMPSYSRFSHHARRALTHARLLVIRFQHPRIDTGHLLVGVMLTRGSLGYDVLQDFDFDSEQASVFLKSMTLPLEGPPDDPPNDAALDICLDLARNESDWLGHHYVGTEHLLLGITRTNVGNAADLLHYLGVLPDQLRRRVRQVVTEGASEYSLEIVRHDARLSELSRRIITAAEQLAVAQDHETVGLGHLLLVLKRERRSITSTLLDAVNMTEKQVIACLGRGDKTALISIEHIIVQAKEHAQNRGSHYTGSEHLLLAIALDSHGADLLRQLDIQPAVVARKVESQIRTSR